MVSGAAILSGHYDLGWRSGHNTSGLDSLSIQELRDLYGHNKVLPSGYEKPALIALSYYPRLSDIRIEFRYTTKGPPLQARPTIWSTLTRSASKRTYLIKIAVKSNPIFEPILLENLPFDAQVGVLGHELAHIQEFSNKSFWGMLGVLFGNLSSKYMDRMEYATDDLVIRQGLGYQLLAWSIHCTRAVEDYLQSQKGEIPGFLKGALQNERYMKPATIKKRMSELEIYRSTN